MNTSNNFPPLFPSSKYLNYRPWHKPVWLISFIYSACSTYSFFLTFLVLLNSLRLISLNINVVLTLPMSLPLSLLMFFSKPVPHPGTNISYPVFQNPDWGLIILMIYFFGSIFLPSIIYRIILSAAYGRKWKK